MKFVKYVLAMAVAGGIALIAAGPAAADKCPSKESVLNASKSNPPFQCAQHENSGTKEVGLMETNSWTDAVSIAYSGGATCVYASSDAVKVTTGIGYGSFTATGTNWTANGARHWAAGVLWQTGDVDAGQYSTSRDCGDTKGHISNSIMRITEGVTLNQPTAPFIGGVQAVATGTVSPSSANGDVVLYLDGQPMMKAGKPVHATVKDGKFTINWTVPNSQGNHMLTAVYGGDTSGCPALAGSCAWTPMASNNVPISIMGSLGSTPNHGSGESSLPVAHSPEPIVPVASISAKKDPRITVIDASARMPASLGRQCPDGNFPINAEIYGANPSRNLSYGPKGISVKAQGLKAGKRVEIQLVCRQNGGGRVQGNRVTFGSKGADVTATRAHHGLVLGGPGNDRLTAKYRSSTVNGGLGNDRLVVRRADGVAIGGPGNDVILSKTAGRSLLIGRQGNDRIVATGKARVNVADGQRDVVTCKGSKVLVLADSKDVLKGDCRRV